MINVMKKINIIKKIIVLFLLIIHNKSVYSQIPDIYFEEIFANEIAQDLEMSNIPFEAEEPNQEHTENMDNMLYEQWLANKNYTEKLIPFYQSFTNKHSLTDSNTFIILKEFFNNPNLIRSFNSEDIEKNYKNKSDFYRFMLNPNKEDARKIARLMNIDNENYEKDIINVFEQIQKTTKNEINTYIQTKKKISNKNSPFSIIFTPENQYILKCDENNNLYVLSKEEREKILATPKIETKNINDPSIPSMPTNKPFLVTISPTPIPFTKEFLLENAYIHSFRENFQKEISLFKKYQKLFKATLFLSPTQYHILHCKTSILIPELTKHEYKEIKKLNKYHKKGTIRMFFDTDIAKESVSIPEKINEQIIFFHDTPVSEIEKIINQLLEHPSIVQSMNNDKKRLRLYNLNNPIKYEETIIYHIEEGFNKYNIPFGKDEKTGYEKIISPENTVELFKTVRENTQKNFLNEYKSLQFIPRYSLIELEKLRKMWFKEFVSTSFEKHENVIIEPSNIMDEFLIILKQCFPECNFKEKSKQDDLEAASEEVLSLLIQKNIPTNIHLVTKKDNKQIQKLCEYNKNVKYYKISTNNLYQHLHSGLRSLGFNYKYPRYNIELHDELLHILIKKNFQENQKEIIEECIKITIEKLIKFLKEKIESTLCHEIYSIYEKNSSLNNSGTEQEKEIVSLKKQYQREFQRQYESSEELKTIVRKFKETPISEHQNTLERILFEDSGDGKNKDGLKGSVIPLVDFINGEENQHMAFPIPKIMQQALDRFEAYCKEHQNIINKQTLLKGLGEDMRERNFYLYGPAGTGKTTATKIFARELNQKIIKYYGSEYSYQYYVIRIDGLQNSYKNSESAAIRRLTEAMKEAERNKSIYGTIFIFDETTIIDNIKQQNKNEAATDSRPNLTADNWKKIANEGESLSNVFIFTSNSAPTTDDGATRRMASEMVDAPAPKESAKFIFHALFDTKKIKLESKLEYLSAQIRRATMTISTLTKILKLSKKSIEDAPVPENMAEALASALIISNTPKLTDQIKNVSLLKKNNDFVNAKAANEQEWTNKHNGLLKFSEIAISCLSLLFPSLAHAKNLMPTVKSMISENSGMESKNSILQKEFSKLAKLIEYPCFESIAATSKEAINVITSNIKNITNDDEKIKNNTLMYYFLKHFQPLFSINIEITETLNQEYFSLLAPLAEEKIIKKKDKKLIIAPNFAITIAKEPMENVKYIYSPIKNHNDEMSTQPKYCIPTILKRAQFLEENTSINIEKYIDQAIKIEDPMKLRILRMVERIPETFSERELFIERKEYFQMLLDICPQKRPYLLKKENTKCPNIKSMFTAMLGELPTNAILETIEKMEASLEEKPQKFQELYLKKLTETYFFRYYTIDLFSMLEEKLSEQNTKKKAENYLNCLLISASQPPTGKINLKNLSINLSYINKHHELTFDDLQQRTLLELTEETDKYNTEAVLNFFMKNNNFLLSHKHEPESLLQSALENQSPNENDNIEAKKQLFEANKTELLKTKKNIDALKKYKSKYNQKTRENINKYCNKEFYAFGAILQIIIHADGHIPIKNTKVKKLLEIINSNSTEKNELIKELEEYECPEYSEQENTEIENKVDSIIKIIQPDNIKNGVCHKLQRGLAELYTLHKRYYEEE